MKYIALPTVVEAEVIEVVPKGEEIVQVGDYLVKDHGKTYVLPKAEFERKYHSAAKSGHQTGA